MSKHRWISDHWYVCQYNVVGGYDALTRSRWKWQARLWQWLINTDPVTKEFPLLLVKNYFSDERDQHASHRKPDSWRKRLAYQALHLRRVPHGQQNVGPQELPGACGTAVG